MRDSFVTAYLKMARIHFQEKVAEMNVVFYDTQRSRSTRRVGERGASEA